MNIVLGEVVYNSMGDKDIKWKSLYK